MTEAEWLVCEDAQEMRRYLRRELNAHRRISGVRKLTLFGCACCRDHWDELPNDKLRSVVAAVEARADGEPTSDPAFLLKSACQGLVESEEGWSSPTVFRSGADSVYTLVSGRYPADPSLADEAMRIHEGECDAVNYRVWRARLRVLAGHLRDIFGNPFRPVTFSKSWRTEHTVGIAAKMYDERLFDATPILADALEEAGCDNADILTHCREPGIHVRGCWVVDLVLGKA